MQNIKLATPDGFILDADYYSGKGERGVVFVHGATIARNDEPPLVQAATKLAEGGIHTLAFDFRGHGKSSGDSAKDPSIEGELTDLETAIHYLRDQGVTKIGIVAASFGASIAALHVARHHDEVAALLLSNPVLNYTTAFFEPTTELSRQFFGHAHKVLETEDHVVLPWNNFRMGRRIFDDMKSHDPLVALQKYKGPLLIIHGDADKDISFDDCQRFYAALSNPQRAFLAVQGGKHAFRDEPHTTDVANAIVNFFSRELGVHPVRSVV